MISNISFTGVKHNPEQYKGKKNNYQKNPIKPEQDKFIPSFKEPRTKTTIFKTIADAIVNFCNKISQNPDAQALERAMTMSDDEKRIYFSEFLFSDEAYGKNIKDRLFALDLFEKCGSDLYKPSSDFKTSQNIDFFKYLNKNSNKELQKKYIEVFEKYTKIKPEELSEEMIKTMYFPMDIKNIEQAIKKLGNYKKQQEMHELFSKRMDELRKEPGFYLRYNFLKSIEKYLYPSQDITKEEKDAVYEKFGIKYGSNLINKMFYPLSKSEMLNLANYAASSSENFKYCMDNIEYLVLLSNSGSIIQNSTLEPETFKMVIESAKDFICSDTKENNIDAVIDYTNNGSYGTINGMPRFLAKIDEIKNILIQKNSTQDVELKLMELKDITEKMYRLGENITSGIENKALFMVKIKSIENNIREDDYITQDIIKDLDELKALVLEKYETCQIKNTVDNLNTLLDKKILKDNPTEFIRYEGNQILEQLPYPQKQPPSENNDEAFLEFLNKEKPTLIQPSYTSTSVSPYFVKINSSIVWTLKGDKNTKGNYLGDIRHIFYDTSKTSLKKKCEAEFLFAPNAKLKIQNAKLDQSGYKIEAIITHDAWF